MESISISLQNSSFEYDESGVLQHINVGYQGKAEEGDIFFQGTMNLSPEEADEFGVRELHKAVTKKLRDNMPTLA